MKRAAVASAVRAKSRTAKPQAAERRQRTRWAPALVPNHVRAGAYEVGDAAAAVEIGRAAPRIAVPHAPALRAVLGNRARLERLEAHAGPAARLACELLGAQAFAVRNVLVFREAQPRLSRVLHEVAHALQQGGDREAAPARFDPGSLELKSGSRCAEQQAEAYAAGELGTLSPAPLGVYRVVTLT